DVCSSAWADKTRDDTIQGVSSEGSPSTAPNTRRTTGTPLMDPTTSSVVDTRATRPDGGMTVSVPSSARIVIAWGVRFNILLSPMIVIRPRCDYPFKAARAAKGFPAACAAAYSDEGPR